MPKTLKFELSEIIPDWNDEIWSNINAQRVDSSLLPIVNETKISSRSVVIFQSFVDDGVLPELPGVDPLSQRQKEDDVFKKNTVFNILASVRIAKGSVKEVLIGKKLENDDLCVKDLWQTALSGARLSEPSNSSATPQKQGGESDALSPTSTEKSTGSEQNPERSPSPKKQTPAQSPAGNVGGTPDVIKASGQAPKKKSSKVKEQQNIFMRALIAITYLFRALAYMLWSPMLGFVYSSMDRMELSSKEERVKLSKEYEVTPVIPQKWVGSGSENSSAASKSLKLN